MWDITSDGASNARIAPTNKIRDDVSFGSTTRLRIERFIMTYYIDDAVLIQLSKLLNARINVEYCHISKSIKYIYRKY